MRDQLSPKQVARAMNVSESSVKRWCDRGMLPTVRTAGGHRRIPLQGVLDFLRTTDQELARPEVLGLPATTGRGAGVIGRAGDRLCESLLAGDEERCRQIVFDLYLAGHRLSSLADEVLADCFRKIGDRWECGDAEVYQERRGCEIALRILHELLHSMPPPAANSPLAIGGAVEGDRYQLPTTMVELVLRECGWKAISLGSNLPFATLGAAIEAHRPRLFWLSASHIADEAVFLRDYSEFYDKYESQTAIVVGGRALAAPLRLSMKFAAHCDNMRHLEAFANTLLKANLTNPPHETPQ